MLGKAGKIDEHCLAIEILYGGLFMESQGTEADIGGNSKDTQYLIPPSDTQYLILSVPQSCSSFHSLTWKA